MISASAKMLILHESNCLGKNTFLGMLADAMAPMPLHPLYCSLRKTAYISLKYEEIGENELMGHPVNAHERALLTVEVLRKMQTEKGRKLVT